MTKVLKLSTISQMKSEPSYQPAKAAKFNLDFEPKLCQSIIAKEKAKISEVTSVSRIRSNTVTNRRSALKTGIERPMQIQLAALDLREPEVKSVKLEGYSPIQRQARQDRYTLTPTLSFETEEATQVVRGWQRRLRSVVSPSLPKSPVSVSECLSNQEISKGLKMCYGSGKSRSLRPGERAVIVSYIKGFSSDSWQVSHQTVMTQDLLSILLKRCRMPYLSHFPSCVKQIYSLWKAEHTKEQANSQYTEDPVLSKIDGADDCSRKQYLPLSMLYRKHLKFI